MEDPANQAALVPLDDRQADRLMAAGALGVGAAEVRVWAANAWGAPVFGGAVTVTVDGVPTDVDLARGAVAVSFDTIGRHTVTLPAGGRADAVVVAPTWVGPTAPRLTPAALAAEHAFAAGEALITRVDTGDGVVISWVPPTGAPVQLAARPTLRGARAVDLDGDPFVDVLLWDDHDVVTLRGRDEGPPMWAGGLQLLDGELRAVDVADTARDRAPELVAVVELDGASFAEVHELTPSGAWATRGRLEAADAPVNALLGREDGAPLALTVGTSGDLASFTASDDGWQLTGSNRPVDLPADAELRLTELTGDDVPDVFAAAPRSPGLPRTLMVLDRGAQPQAWVARQPIGAWWALGDGDGDGVDDVWSLDAGGTLRLLARLGASPVEFNLGPLPYPGAFAPIVTPGATRLSVAGTPASAWTGGPRDEGPWRTDDVDTDGLLEGLVAVWSDPAQTPGEARWTGAQVRDGVAYLKRWSRTDGDPTVQELRRASLGVADVHDAARCGGIVWLAVGGDLLALDSDTFDELGRWTPPSPRRVACDDDATAVVLSDGQRWVVTLDAPLGEATSAAGAVDVAWTGSGAEAAPTTCEVPGCRVIGWSLPTGRVAVTVDHDGVRLGDALVPGLVGPAEPLAVDVDDDDVEDLVLLQPSGAVWVLRALPDGPAEPEGWHLRRGLAGAAMVADADGDGDGDLFVVDETGRLLLVR